MSSQPPSVRESAFPEGAGARPFSQLDPNTVLDALQSVGLYGDGRMLALNSYENRVYQVGMDEGPPVVVKFYRPGRWSDAAILEEHALVMALVEQEVPAVPPRVIGGSTLHTFNEFRFAAFDRHGGRAPELDDADTLARLGRFIARLHVVGAAEDYVRRPALDIQTFGFSPRDALLDMGCIPEELRASWRNAVDEALARVQEGFDDAGAVARLRLHGDCHVGNVLWTDAGPHFVDFDDSRMGPAVQDLWMLLSGDRAERTRQLGQLIDGYEDIREFDRRELRLIEPLRTLRLIHYAAWLAARWDDPAFPSAFPWFGTFQYWQDRIVELREQAAAMAAPPLVA